MPDLRTRLTYLIDERTGLWHNVMKPLADKGEMTGDEAEKYNRAEARVDELDSEIEQTRKQIDESNPNVQRQRDLAAEANGPGLPAPPSGEHGPLSRSESLADWVATHRGADAGSGGSFGRLLQGLITGRWDAAEAEMRAVGAQTGTAGGYLVPESLSSQVIDLARAQARVMQAGAQTFPLDSGEVSVARVAKAPQPAWRAEHGTIPESDANFERITFYPKSLAVLTRVSREWAEDTRDGPQVLENAISESIGLELDRVALRGASGEAEPTGVLNRAATTEALNAEPTWDNLIDSAGVLADANHTANAFIHAPRSERKLQKQKDANNQYIAPPQALAGLDRLPTTQVPTDLGTGSDESEIHTGEWSELLFGVRTELQLGVLTERYADQGQIGIVAWARADMHVRHTEAFHVYTGVL